MNKLSFSQKNDLVVKHKSRKHFGKDSELFQKHFPSNKLMNDLARANEFTFERLDGQILYLLLDKVPMDEILKNRKAIPVDEPPVPPVDDLTVPPVDPVDEKLKSLEERIQELEDSNFYNEDEIQELRNDLEDKDSSIEELQSKIEELEQKSSKKKEDES